MIKHDCRQKESSLEKQMSIYRQLEICLHFLCNQPSNKKREIPLNKTKKIPFFIHYFKAKTKLVT